MSGRKKCSRERCVEPTAAGRIRPTFLLTTLISVRLSTYSVWCLLLFNLGTPYNTTGRCRCYNTLLLLHLTVATAVQGCDETLREKEEIKLRPVQHVLQLGFQHYNIRCKTCGGKDYNNNCCQSDHSTKNVFGKKPFQVIIVIRSWFLKNDNLKCVLPNKCNLETQILR